MDPRSKTVHTGGAILGQISQAVFRTLIGITAASFCLLALNLQRLFNDKTLREK